MEDRREEEAAVPDREEFVRVAESFRAELTAYCYQVLGSVGDAQDTVQEVYARAWRAFDRFEGRSSIRVWLYRITTNACLTALERRSRRPLPSGLVAAEIDPGAPLEPGGATTWLEPLPNTVLAAGSADPAAVVASRDRMRLALTVALQHLPARQRVVLILRDVLMIPAAEVAEFLDTTTAAVKSALQRARAHLSRVAPVEEDIEEPSEPELNDLLRRYTSAFEDADVEALMSLMREDVEFEMPPWRTWFTGKSAVRHLATRVLGEPGRWRLAPTGANGQPAFAAYQLEGAAYRAHALQVLTVTSTGIARIVVFLDPGLFPRFGLPESLPAAAESR